MPSGDPSKGQALDIFDDGHSRLTDDTGAIRRAISFRVEGLVSGGDGRSAHEELCQLHAAAVDGLTSEPTLGGLVEFIEDGDCSVDVAAFSNERRLFFSQQFTTQFAVPLGRLSDTI